MAAAERVRSAIASAILPASLVGLEFSASIGVAVLRGHDTDEMLRQVDDALYSAKANGRNRVEAEVRTETATDEGLTLTWGRCPAVALTA